MTNNKLKLMIMLMIKEAIYINLKSRYNIIRIIYFISQYVFNNIFCMYYSICNFIFYVSNAFFFFK